jgi:four helix bundle protein
MAFNHEKLKVYQRTLSFNVKVSSWTGEWDHRHAIRDHLHRAAESMLENIAMASAAYSEIKIRSLDFAIGSSLECAACLDLARLKRLLDAERVYAEKEELSQILRMLVGLRTSWARMPQMVREDADEYRVANAGVDEAADKTHENESKETVLFHHETLDVYRLATQAVAAVCSSEEVPRLSNSVFRRLDELLTSMVLNIAEGNGRFSGDDQARFLGTSHEASIKLAT